MDHHAAVGDSAGDARALFRTNVERDMLRHLRFLKIAEAPVISEDCSRLTRTRPDHSRPILRGASILINSGHTGIYMCRGFCLLVGTSETGSEGGTLALR